MNDNKPIDDIASTLRTWSEKLTVGLAAAGLQCEYHSHAGSSTMRLGRMTVTDPKAPDIEYHIDFERKLVVKDNQRRLITQLEVYNPIGKLHVHVLKFSPEMVAKIVTYAQRTIEVKQTREAADDARRRRTTEGMAIYRKVMEGFPMPDWARAACNVDNDADVGTFRLLFSDHLRDWPLARLTPKQVKMVIDAVRAATCPTDTKVMPNMAWRPANEPVPPELQSTPMKVTMLLLAIEGREQPVRGWFMGGLVNEFYMEGSPNQWKPTHWMPMPDMP